MTESFTLFYGKSDDTGGIFSQWYPCVFHVHNIKYTSAEQFMMAEKARLFHDIKCEKLIMKAKHPRDQKSIGRSIENFNETEWNKVARDIVYRGNYAKFTQNPVLLEKLLATGTTTLVECSPTDTIWGIGRGLKDPLALRRENWKGKNWLGEVLTKLREDIIGR